MRYGVELEVVFAFNLRLLREIQKRYIKENPTVWLPKGNFTVYSDIPYDVRNKPPFNPWGFELPFRAYNSFAIGGDTEGSEVPYTYEIPYMMAECLKNHPDVNFNIQFYDEAAESNKNRDRYKTW